MNFDIKQLEKLNSNKEEKFFYIATYGCPSVI